MGVFQKIQKLVKKIPRGKITTYGKIAEVSGIKDARVVGWALHQNKNPAIPCHRVVNQAGFLAKNYAFGGAKRQKEKLEKEGVKFINKFRVDLAHHSWKPKY
jgi:methylated-DNA-protein-cysteine methyltransferase-like protein